MKLRRGCAACLCWMSIAALATPAATERERIASERAAAKAKFSAQERVCQTQFVVSPCVDAARQEQRATLEHLRRQELVLDEAKRREAAAARMQANREKAEAQQARASDAAPAPPRDGAREAPKPHPPVSKRVDGDGLGKPANEVSDAERRATEQRNQAKFEARMRAAQAHRQAVELRNAQRAAQGKVAAPLPVPSGASAP